MKTVYSILALFIVNFLHGQNFETMFMETDTSTVSDKKFDFKPISENVSIEEKMNFFIDNIVLGDTASVYQHTGFVSPEKVKNLKNNKAKLFSTFDTAAIDRNLHFLDLNGDANLDCIYDELDLKSQFQSIEILLSTQKETIKSINVPGFIITDFQKNENQFNTFAWACCDETFRSYWTIKLGEDAILEETKYSIPRNIEKPNEIKKEEKYKTNKDLKIYERPNNEMPLSYLDHEVIIPKGSDLLPISSKHNGKWSLVIGPFIHEEINKGNKKIVGWIKQ